MEEYFNATLNKLKSNNYSQLTIILGNESCDLDSAVSSLVYAVFLAWQRQLKQCKAETATDGQDDLFVSVLNTVRDDFPLKTELVSHFKENSISADKLVFRDDIDLTQLSTSERFKVILVDHHTLASGDQFLAPHVSEIIDHRPLDKTNWGFKEGTRSTIETVGSCCTLIAQRVKDLSKLMARGDDFFNTYPVCTNMLHSTIILDTVNFSKELNKATPRDVEVVTFLEALMRTEDVETERKRKLDRLSSAKSDVSHLSAAQLLRKDVKTFGNVLVPSFPILVQEFLLKPLCVEALSEALVQRHCTIAVLLGMDYREGMKRDMAVYSDRHGTAEQLGNFLESWSSSALQLTPLPPPGPLCRYYKQLNLTATRKQYVPAINDYLASQNR